MNSDLTSAYTPEKVQKALFSIGDTKAPGTDGLHAIFLKNTGVLLGALL
jgi:hypothetical protein